MAIYKGFSSLGFSDYGGNRRAFTSTVQGVSVGQRIYTSLPAAVGANHLLLTDVELVERNLLNHMFTRKGERVMMPTFGSIIPDLLFEPLDEELVETVRAEVGRVIKYDPRVQLIALSVRPDFGLHLLTISMELKYIELNITANTTLNLQFDQ